MESTHTAARPQPRRCIDRLLRDSPFRFFSMRSQRLKDLMDFARHEFGGALPDDDYGRDVLREILNQLALMGAETEFLRERGRDLLPEIDADDSLDDMIKEIGRGRRIKAAPLGRAIGLTFRARVAIDIRTIDCADVSPARRRAITAQKRAMDKRWAREKAGAAPQARSARQAKPWEAEGISRSTFYARKKHMAEPVQRSSAGPIRPEYDVVVTTSSTDGPARSVPPVAPAHRPSHQRDNLTAEKVSLGEQAPAASAPAGSTRAEGLEEASQWVNVDGPVATAGTARAALDDDAARRAYLERRARHFARERQRLPKLDGIAASATRAAVQREGARLHAVAMARQRETPAHRRWRERRSATIAEAEAAGLICGGSA